MPTNRELEIVMKLKDEITKRLQAVFNKIPPARELTGAALQCYSQILAARE